MQRSSRTVRRDDEDGAGVYGPAVLLLRDVSGSPGDAHEKGKGRRRRERVSSASFPRRSRRVQTNGHAKYVMKSNQ